MHAWSIYKRIRRMDNTVLCHTYIYVSLFVISRFTGAVLEMRLTLSTMLKDSWCQLITAIAGSPLSTTRKDNPVKFSIRLETPSITATMREVKGLFIADNHGYNISYIYDSQFRLIEIRKSNDSSLISRFDYVNGVVVRKMLGNGAYSLYTYDEGKRLEQLENFLPDQTLSSSNRYDYDQKGRVTKMTDSSNQTWVYKYDIKGQLTGWTSSSGESVRHAYDNRGNRLMTEKGESTGRYSVNSMNQYTSYNGTEQFSYDLNGNLVRKVTPRGMESFGYDADGTLIFTETLNNR